MDWEYRVRCCCHDEDVVVLIVECGFVLCSSGDQKNCRRLDGKKVILPASRNLNGAEPKLALARCLWIVLDFNGFTLVNLARVEGFPFRLQRLRVKPVSQSLVSSST